MSATVIRLVLNCQPRPLQLCPIWTCNNVQKWFATLSKKLLQKTYPDYGFANVMIMPYPSSQMEKQVASTLSESMLLIKMCPPYESNGYEEPSEIIMANEKYKDGFTLNTGGMSYAIFNLEGKYKSLEFDLGHVDGTYMNNATFEIYLDGEFVEKIAVTAEELPKHCTIDLNESQQMKIVSVEEAFWYPQYGFVNAVLYE